MSGDNLAKSEELVFGYIRNIQQHKMAMCPEELYFIVLSFYAKYSLYGIGTASYPPFGSKQEYVSKHYHYPSLSAQKKWHYLSIMSSLCDHPTSITSTFRGFFIHNTNIQNEIYMISTNDNENFPIITFENNPIIDLDIWSEGMWNGHSFFVLKDTHNIQSIYAIGSNRYGQQGFKNTENNLQNIDTYNSIATKINALNKIFNGINIIEITTGFKHSLFLTSLGIVYSCGSNDHGQCGKVEIDNDSIAKPQIVSFGNTNAHITHISSGQHHNLCLDIKNNVWCFGDNTYHQLGLGLMNDYDTATTIEKPIKNIFFKKKKITQIECGNNHSLCLSKKGKAYIFGNNMCAQCGGGTTQYKHVPFCLQSIEICKNVLFESGSCGINHTMLISYKPNNDLWGFGGNKFYQTGNYNTEHADCQTIPYLNLKKDIGIQQNQKIIKVLCDQFISIFACD
eukprot:459507_1